MTRQVSRIARSRTESQSGRRPCFGRVASTSWGATDPTQLVWTSAFSPASGELGLPSRRELGRGGLLRVLGAWVAIGSRGRWAAKSTVALVVIDGDSLGLTVVPPFGGLPGATRGLLGGAPGRVSWGSGAPGRLRGGA